MTLWSILDPISFDYLPPLFNPTSNPPQYTVDIFFTNRALVVWISIALYGINGITVLAVAILAILTRKVHLDCFKDTKKVNIFVFSTVLCLTLWFPYLYVFTFVAPVVVAGYIVNVLSYFVIPFLCKVFLFVPKIWSARHERMKEPRKSYHMKTKSHDFNDPSTLAL